MAVVQEVWNKPVHNKNAAATLSHKFKALQHALKRLTRHISRLSIAITNCNAVLADLDKLENKGCLKLPETNFRNILRTHLIKLLKYHKFCWKRHCTIRWIKLGDENTKFFHAMATERHRRNSIASLKLPDGTMVSDHSQMEGIIWNCFKIEWALQGVSTWALISPL